MIQFVLGRLFIRIGYTIYALHHRSNEKLIRAREISALVFCTLGWYSVRTESCFVRMCSIAFSSTEMAVMGYLSFRAFFLPPLGEWCVM